jgi:SAM-dependent methyltransferase
VAVDVGRRYAEDFASRGIEFACRDLEKDGLDDLGPVDVAICSDVFEHLINPAAALDRIADVLGESGILFSHVPNEYRLGHIVRVMLSRSETVLFHKGKGAHEWSDPHFRRFSDTGYRSFLSQRFAHNLKLSDLRYGWPARLVCRLGMAVPYCLQGGPTYASTNDPRIFERLIELKKEKAHGKV